MTRTGIVKDARFMDHHTLEGHAENHRRLAVIYDMLEQADMNGRFVEILPRMARREEICRIHSPDYFDQIASTADRAPAALTPDTHVSEGSFHTALLAAGGLMEAAAAVVSGRLSNAFALIRPPGHHAEKNRAMGYCLFNNVALAACFALETLGLRKVLVVDWDVHHGNGTQHFFEASDQVLFFSIHQYPHFPGTGYFTETGRGRGEGFTINIPIPSGYGDAEFAAIFQQLLQPVALEYQPELVLVSAGFDTHGSDPMGQMRMTPPGYACLTRTLMHIADQCCDGKVVLALEGGYHLETLGDSVKAVLDELSDATRSRTDLLAQQANPKKLNYAVFRCSHVHRQFWKCMRSMT